jgi:hypothetical protein
MLTLTGGPVSLATMVTIAFVGSWVRWAGNNYLFILAADVDAWANHYFLNETCFPKILEPIK